MTPGISPFSASERKHKRQMPNLRRNARGRPHRLQRLCWRLENFGFRLSFTRFAVVAILLPIVVLQYSVLRSCLLQICYAARKGRPRPRSNARAWSSDFAVVTTVTFIPLSFSALE